MSFVFNFFVHNLSHSNHPFWLLLLFANRLSNSGACAMTNSIKCPINFQNHNKTSEDNFSCLHVGFAIFIAAAYSPLKGGPCSQSYGLWTSAAVLKDLTVCERDRRGAGGCLTHQLAAKSSDAFWWRALPSPIICRRVKGFVFHLQRNKKLPIPPLPTGPSNFLISTVKVAIN